MAWLPSHPTSSRRTFQSTTKISQHSQGQTTKRKTQAATMKTKRSVRRTSAGCRSLFFFFKHPVMSESLLLSVCSKQNLNLSGKTSSSSDGPKFPGDKSSAPSNNNQQKKGIQVLPDGKKLAVIADKLPVLKDLCVVAERSLTVFKPVAFHSTGETEKRSCKS